MSPPGCIINRLENYRTIARSGEPHWRVDIDQPRSHRGDGLIRHDDPQSGSAIPSEDFSVFGFTLYIVTGTTAPAVKLAMAICKAMHGRGAWVVCCRYPCYESTIADASIGNSKVGTVPRGYCRRGIVFPGTG